MVSNILSFNKNLGFVSLVVLASLLGSANLQAMDVEKGEGKSHSRRKLTQPTSGKGLLTRTYEEGQSLYAAQNYEMARDHFEIVAQHGYPPADCYLGVLYKDHLNDYKKAITHFTLAAEKGQGEAMFNLAVMHLKGLGVTKNPVKALTWLEAAKEKECPDINKVIAVTKFDIGALCNNAEVPDYSEAIKWLKESDQDGHPGAKKAIAQVQYNMGLDFYEQEQFKNAVFWYKKAAEGGDADASYNLGEMYRDGDGVPSSKSKAIKWFEVAKKNGHTEAQAAIDAIKKPTAQNGSVTKADKRHTII